MTTGGNLLYRALEQNMPGVLSRRYRDLAFENGKIVPTKADLKPGAAEVVRNTIDEVGDADIVGDGAFDIPIVDVSANEDRYKVFMIASAFSYTFQQERAYSFAGAKADIDNRKQMLAKRSIAERHHRIAAFGDTRLNVTGFLNNAGVALNNSSFDPNTAAPDELAEFFVDELKAAHTASNNVEMPMDVLISTGFYFKLVKTRMPDSSVSVLTYIKQALSEEDVNFNITKCQECDSAQLETNGVQALSTNKDLITLYTKDPEVVERHIELVQMMPQEWITVRDGRRVYPMFSSTTSTIINYPGAFRYIKVPKVN
ncbi:DUF2184 domain-containing protein [Nostoc sp. CENA67]|uniref:DUF2184 domain-containing protein n=1 Tax=Amazonocrinis nigriterrae CENA67 TaxID=2794033 RepID=A0A8J7LEG8_9NOST|nr:major capsid family protein [Amazonocrinis nigriterrae]MBH8566721.1 DUF2184 domain-containing protein [Amazonocrinis nigriterrae CENA67]